MTKPTEIVPDLLYAGPITCLDPDDLEPLVEGGVRRIISVLPIGRLPCDQTANDIRGTLVGFDVEHRIVVASDDAVLPPDYVAHALGDKVPTLIHCNAGQNRSTALAACWLLLHGYHREAAGALARVMILREKDAGAPLRLWPQMEKNVEAFAAWRESR